ncbi:MAG: hypothetical protein GC179_23745 [Anaerolineaceae bacterium]|nr:hypothetical protein [Anaerolineaceae bacterium]
MMTRIYIKLFMFFMMLLSAGALTASVLGRFRSTNPVLDGIVQGCENQPQPCWYGIRPGKTSLEDALQVVSQTDYVKLQRNSHLVTLVYRNTDMRCGVELRIEAGIVDTVTIINCLDRQVGDLVKAMHNATHKLPFSMGMLDTIMTEETRDSYDNYIPCTAYTPYGQIIGMPLSLSGEPAVTKPAGWNDFLPYGWYVHTGGSLSCDIVDGLTKVS